MRTSPHRNFANNNRNTDSIFNPTPNQPATIDSRLSDAAQTQLVNSFRSLSLGESDLPSRPGFGTLGTPIKLRSNYYALRLPKGTISEYDTKIKPAIDQKRRRIRLFEILEEMPEYQQYKPYVAHDYAAKLVAARRLPQPLVFEIFYFEDDEDGPNERSKKYTIEITFVQDLDLSAIAK